MRKTLIVLSCVALAGCATPSSEYSHTDADGSKTSMKSTKEVDAEKLNARVSPKTGAISVKADKLSTKSVPVIKAMGEREAGNIKAAGEAATAIKGAVTGGLGGTSATNSIPSIPGVPSLP